MFEGLFQPLHLIIILMFLVIVVGGVFLVFRVHWRLGSAPQHRGHKADLLKTRPSLDDRRRKGAMDAEAGACHP
jgi:hypothetical protein